MIGENKSLVWCPFLSFSVEIFGSEWSCAKNHLERKFAHESYLLPAIGDLFHFSSKLVEFYTKNMVLFIESKKLIPTNFCDQFLLKINEKL